MHQIPFKNKILSLFLWFSSIIITIIGIVISCFITNRVARSGFMTSFAAKPLVWMSKILCKAKITVLGKENLPKDTTVIFVSNHNSLFETVFFNTVLPPISWVLKKEALYFPIFGIGLLLTSPIIINRQNRQKARVVLLKQALKKLSQGLNIMIFPEGTRVKKGQKRPYKKGIAHIIQATNYNYAVVPIAHNFEKLMPRKSAFIMPGNATMKIGKPILFNKQQDIEEITSIIQKTIEGLYSDIKKYEENL